MINNHRCQDKEPNDNIMQNIPSKNQEIRLIFRASDGHVLVGSDYSQQEP